MPRILRNLRINEVSGVDRAAGRGVKIMLMKRDADDDVQVVHRPPTEEDVMKAQMRNTELKRMAFDAWSEQVAEVCKRDGISQSAAMDRLQQTDVGSRLWTIIKNFTGADVLSGVGFVPDWPELGGRVRSETWNSPHGATSNPPDPHRSVRHDAADDEVGRLRDAHAARKTFMDRVRRLREANPTWSHPQAVAAAQKVAAPEEWAAYKSNPDTGDVHVPATGRSPLMPPSHDANAPRGATPAGVDAANRSSARRARRPYERV